MKNYGMNKATEFYKGNINFIYKNAKQGNIEIERWLISEFYDLADYYGPDYNGSVEQDERNIKRILTALEKEDYEEAQEIIDYMNSKQNLYSKKIQDRMNHETIGQRKVKEEVKEEKTIEEKVSEVEDAYMKIFEKRNVVIDGKVASQYEKIKTIDITGETVEAEIEKCEEKGWLYEIAGMRNEEVIRICGNI